MSQQKPNVLLISVDQWAGRYTGAMGHPCIMTPTLDQIAANGVLFSNCYSSGPVCIPGRRGLMTGTTPQTHGCNCNMNIPMPNLPTLAQTFRDAGYQAYAVGKIHTTPQRDRIGFDDIILNEEGRHETITADDYELFLAEEGYAGQEMTHAQCNNRYLNRPWHLPEYLHPTNWTVREMCRMIYRRDPTKPAFWYMSFNFPHPPLVPLESYLDMYRDADIPEPFIGDWAQDEEALPYALRVHKQIVLPTFNAAQLRLARQAYYAQCTQIDHQIRLVIGTLSEQGLLDNTIICFTADHGEMLGNHRQYNKTLGFEDSAKIHFLLMPTAADPHGIGHHRVDDRLTEIRDIMPTLLDMCGIPIPDSVEGISVLSDQRREYVHSECQYDARANRMIRNDRYKLHYFPAGNRFLLFDMLEDPDEMRDLSADPTYAATVAELEQAMIAHFYGSDMQWVQDGHLVGMPAPELSPRVDRGLTNQRGWRFM